jgi:hypothetical protein
MKNLLTVLGIGGLGWFLWEGMTAAIWWEIGKWVGTGLLSLIILYVLIWNIRNRAEQRAWETRRQGDKETRRQAQYHPQMLYIPQQPAYSQQPPQAPAGLVDLPLDKYEWEV